MLAHGFIRPAALVRLGLLMVAFAGATSPACQRVPLVAPSGTAMTLVASTNSVAINGATDITAVLIEGVTGGSTTGGAAATVGGGSPVHNGTLVTFTTTLGRIEPAEARTNAGRVTVRLLADGRSGTATVTAFSGAATESIELSVGAAAAARIAVTASPQALPGTGGTATISARVEDQQGNGLSGVPVSFSTTQGDLVPTSAVSNDQGVATTVLTLTTAGPATVTANAGGATAGVTGTVTVTVKPRTTVSIAAPASATVGVPATFTITPSAEAVIVRVDVDFGDGSSASLGAITSATTVSHPFRFKGVSTVTARATDSEGGVGSSSTQIAVSPLQVTLSATPLSSTQPQVGTVVTFTAAVTTGAIVDRYEWLFGDGRPAVSTSSNQAVRTFATAGEYVVSVQVFPLGSSEFATALVTVPVKP